MLSNSAGSLFPSRRRNLASRVSNTLEQETTIPNSLNSPNPSRRPGSPGRSSTLIGTQVVSQPSAPPEKFSTVTLPNVAPVSIMTTPRAVHVNNPQVPKIESTIEDKPEINAKNVDTELLSYGYVPINKVLLGQGSEAQRIKYVKAYNPYGELVYIFLDGEGMCQGNLCTTMDEVKTGTIIPSTLRMTAAECNNLDVCGLAFECEEGICTLHRRKDNPVEFDEQLFAHSRLINTPGRDYLWGKTMALPYPIVRLSEIRANPSLVLAATDESFKRMRNTFYDLTIKELAETGGLYNRLDQEARKFQNNAKIFSSNLMNDIIQLENFAEEHKSLRNPSEDQKQNYRLILSNLRKRHEFLEEYLRHVDHYSRAQTQLSSMIEDLAKLNMKMERTIGNLGKVLPD